MELADLKTLIAVIEAGGITHAAKELHRVPSSITARILQLEESLGVQLFLREKKRLLPTQKGRSLYEDARRIVELADKAEQDVKNTEPGGTFRIGSQETAAAVRLPAILARLHELYPRMQLKLTIGTSRGLCEKIIENSLDAAFVIDTPADGRLERAVAFEEELVLVTPAGHHPVREPVHIECNTALVFQDGCSYRNRLLSWFWSHGREPARVVEFASSHAILGGVIAGMGVGMIPASVLDNYQSRDGLAVHPLPPPFGKSLTELVWRKGMVSANLSSLRESLGNAG